MKSPEEWFAQAEYDLDTAKTMYRSGRYFYVIFMCHLALEKALKGLYTKQFIKEPPKLHSLDYFVAKLGLTMPLNLQTFVSILSDLSVPTRYPDTLQQIQALFTKDQTKDAFKKSKEVLTWLKTQL